MGRKACLAIGISDAPPLDYLPGAVNGAKAIADWASKAGYETELLVDTDQPVSIGDVQGALNKLLPKGAKTDRLIIYFAGHGFAQGVYEDLWLLSEWHQKQVGIGIGKLLARLRRYGIGQLAVVADACRSLTSSEDAVELDPLGVLDLGPYDPKQISIDNLRASSKYKAAYMIPGPTADDDRCIFSGVLEEALWGIHADAIENPDGNPRCITSQSLVKCLSDKVPAKAQEYDVELTPELVPGFLRPDDVYVVMPIEDAPTAKAWPPPGATASLGPGSQSRNQGRRGWSTRDAKSIELPKDLGLDTFGPEAFPEAGEGEYGGGGFGRMGRATIGGDWREEFEEEPSSEPPRQSVKELAEEERILIDADATRRSAKAKRILDSYAEEQAPTHFETGAGVSVTGAKITQVTVGPKGVVSYEPGPFGGWRIQSPNLGYLAEPLPLLVELEDGSWTGAAVMPEFITRIGVERTDKSANPAYQNASLIFRSLRGPAATDADAEKALAQLRAGGVGDQELVDLALNLRREKHVDPILGVIAAYMYFSRGDIESIAQIAYFCTSADQAIPFDIALLAGLQTKRSDGHLVAQVPAIHERTPRSHLEEKYEWTFRHTPAAAGLVAGTFPWLRQGWSLIDEARGALVDPLLDEIASELVPATFTTLTPTGGTRLAESLFGDA
jgi:hypothetical protein